MLNGLPVKKSVQLSTHSKKEDDRITGVTVSTAKVAIHLMKPEAIQRFATLVKQIRVDLGLSQRDFAELLGISQSSFQAWEDGKIKSEPKAKNLRAVADLKGWTVEELMCCLDGKRVTLSATIPDKISVNALKQLIKNLDLSVPELLEVSKFTFSVAESHINNNILSVKRSATIEVFQGTNMTIEGLLKTLSASISLAELEQLLDTVRLPLARFNELANGATPTDDELRQLGLLLDDAGIRNANNIRFSHDDLKVMRGAPKDCRHHHTNGIN